MEETPTAPVAPEAKSEATPTTTNQPTEQTQAQPAEAPKTPDLHGFTEEQLADMAKFYSANGGYEKVKSRLSNPLPKTEQPQASADGQSIQSAQAEPPKNSQPPKGFASLNELSVERYFKDLAADPKYANISEQIANGEVLKEMSAMGMNPVDENYNINVNQLSQFLALKAASVPTKPTSSEPSNIPTVDYVQVGENITDMNQALAVYQQSMEAQSKGLPVHPSLAQAKEFLTKNWGKK